MISSTGIEDDVEDIQSHNFLYGDVCFRCGYDRSQGNEEVTCGTSK